MLEEDRKIFKAEERQAIRFLSTFAVIGHQPAISCWCVMSEKDGRLVETAILAQKIVAPAKICKFAEEQKTDAMMRSVEPSIKLNKTRIHMNRVIKWKRKVMGQVDADADGQRSGNFNTNKPPAYKTRKLTCPKCGTGRETARMQPRTKQGFRDIQCKICKRHARCGWFNVCEVVWHQCLYTGSTP